MARKNRLHPLIQLIKQHKRTGTGGVYSACSAHPMVLTAVMRQALADDSLVCIEATSNQVDQFGGYTGMKPADFSQFVARLAKEVELPLDRIVLGGDHLGPNAWRGEVCTSAMAKAKDLVRAYVAAGFTKIHLDASMPCADDKAAGREFLPDEVVAERAAQLCGICEQTAGKLANTGALPVYVVGTEVPRPGGALDNGEALHATSPRDAQHTIAVTRAAFERLGLHDAWQRVIAVVVQPGVEFSDASVIDYQRKKAARLSHLIEKHPQLVYEAHSTDYQTRQHLREMVQDHFAILKVGPELTFAMREALFALAHIEEEMTPVAGISQPSRLREVLEETMCAKPGNWNKHYHGTASEQAFARKYSYSDRSRYYWPEPRLAAAAQKLIANLQAHRPPLNLLSQYLPEQYRKVREGGLSNEPALLIQDRIQEVCRKYAAACS
jgi:D-tagatose-1,6-bisphosphate aldolase subunit GatZ/KbaZ